MAVALTRGSERQHRGEAAHAQHAGVAARTSATAPSRTTLSTMISVPGRESCSAHWKYSGVLGLSASMKTRSNGEKPSRSSLGSVSIAGPTLIVDERRHAGPGDVGLGHLRVLRVRFERHDPAVGGQRASHPDRAVAAQGADLEDVADAVQAGEQVEQLAHARRDVDRRQAGRFARLHGRLDRRIGLDDQVREVAINRCPGLVRHRRPRPFAPCQEGCYAKLPAFTIPPQSVGRL